MRPWFVDGAFAKKSREIAIEKGHAKAKLAVQPLGRVVGTLLGWAKALSASTEMRILTYADGEAMFARAVAGTPKEEMLKARSWVLPLFFCRKMFTDASKTVYAHHDDLVAEQVALPLHRLAAPPAGHRVSTRGPGGPAPPRAGL